MFFAQVIRMINLSINELELKASNRGIKGYKNISIDKSLCILNKSEHVKKLKLSEI